MKRLFVMTGSPLKKTGCHTETVQLTLFAFVVLAGSMRAENPLKVVPMKMGPEQVAHMFAQQPPAFEACAAAGFEVCPDGFGAPDVSLRWVQLDDGPELEAIVTTKGPGGYVGYLFDHRGSVWNRIGPFMFFREYEGNDLFRVKKLTKDSPTVLIFTRDLGGSASTIVTTTAYHLREGKLFPVFEVTPMQWSGLPPPERMEHSEVLASKDRLVTHKVEEVEKKATHTCEVHRWDANVHEFVAAPADRTAYCDLKTGKPIPGKAYASGIPAFP